MDLSFLGRFHPVLVHLPIGILLIAFLFEVLSRFKGYRKLRYAVRPSLFVGAFAAIVAAITGYWLSTEGGYDERLLMLHRNLGIGTAALAIVVYLHRRYSFIPNKSKRKRVRLALFFVLVVLVTVTGHLGGTITHGEDYLFASAAKPDVIAKRNPILLSNPDQAIVFADVVRPILEQKCFTCHSSKKQKGQLRMDTREWMEKGGKHGKVFVAGNPDESELFKRITLSVEMEHHMPPRERQQLTSLEIDVISAWIDEGASFESHVSELQNPEVMTEFLRTQSQEVNGQDFPAGDVAAADETMLERLRKSNVVILPLAANTNYLFVSFVGKKDVTPEDASGIKSISKNVVELDLAGCKISQEMIRAIADLPQLRKLSLQQSSISDADLQTMTLLKNLAVLNLRSTSISDQGIRSLQGLAALKKIFLYQTAVTKSGVQDLGLLLPKTQIDTGNYSLPFLGSDTVQYKRSR